MQASFAFALLTYVVSWLLWTAAAAILGWDLSRWSSAAVVSGSLYLLGVFAPAFVAIALTAQREGREGVKTLFGRTLMWSVSLRWYLFAIGYFATIKLAVAVMHRLIIGEWPAFIETPWIVLLMAFAVSTPSQAGEEIGWRGYLLPRLSASLGLPAASLVVGVVWAFWHLPFFLIAGTDKSGQSFPAYLLGVTALSVAMAWLYWRTHGSLLLTMVMHAAVNNGNLVPPPPSPPANPFSLTAAFVSWATVAVLWIGGLFFLVAMRKEKRLP
jgi:membrane protease YdiL (CAAX protease family)